MQVGPGAAPDSSKPQWGNHHLGVIRCSPQHTRCRYEKYHNQAAAGLPYSLDAKTTCSKWLKLEQLEEYSYLHVFPV